MRGWVVGCEIECSWSPELVIREGEVRRVRFGESVHIDFEVESGVGGLGTIGITRGVTDGAGARSCCKRFGNGCCGGRGCLA